ncbi:MAG: hypothetical protein IPO15_27440 [Anaerolineae bacterium]|uniref:hypothetical protein n=1 Tax=Candidatus Amarolinea dominans TaxID=3140696 RepID=UPI003134EB3A|nr:hypothetical protein [Anaerolineae bacterium]
MFQPGHDFPLQEPSELGEKIGHRPILESLKTQENGHKVWLGCQPINQTVEQSRLAHLPRGVDGEIMACVNLLHQVIHKRRAPRNVGRH